MDINYIERNKERGFGQPVLKGSRLYVFSIISYASYSGGGVEKFLRDFDVSMDQLKSAVAYCKHLECRNIQLPSDQYCDGCILRSIHEGWTLVRHDQKSTSGIFYSNAGGPAYLRSTDELDEWECGRSGWMMAREVERQLAV